MEKGNSLIRAISYYGMNVLIALVLTLLCVSILPICLEELDKHFNPKQESVDERFIVEYRSIGIGVYHDNELNVTCYRTNMGLSCIPDAEIGRR